MVHYVIVSRKPCQLGPAWTRLRGSSNGPRFIAVAVDAPRIIRAICSVGGRSPRIRQVSRGSSPNFDRNERTHTPSAKCSRLIENEPLPASASRYVAVVRLHEISEDYSRLDGISLLLGRRLLFVFSCSFHFSQTAKQASIPRDHETSDTPNGTEARVLCARLVSFGEHREAA